MSMSGKRPIYSFVLVSIFVILLSTGVGWYFEGEYLIPVSPEILPIVENLTYRGYFQINIHRAYVFCASIVLCFAFYFSPFTRILLVLIFGTVSALFSGILIKIFEIAWGIFLEFKNQQSEIGLGQQFNMIFSGHWTKAIAITIFLVAIIATWDRTMNAGKAIDPDIDERKEKKEADKKNTSSESKKFKFKFWEKSE